MTRYPPGLISALEKLQDDTTVTHSASRPPPTSGSSSRCRGVEDEGKLGSAQPPVRHAPAARGADRRSPGALSTADRRSCGIPTRGPLAIGAAAGLVAGARRVQRRRGQARRRPTRPRRRRPPPTTTDHDDDGGHDHRRRHRPRRRRRARLRRSPACRSPTRPTASRPGARGQDRQPTPRARRPQAGLNQADVVFEEIVEGITRFVAVFQSTDADPVGPDPLGPHHRRRPARPSSNRPLFAWSGGNGDVVAADQRGPTLIDVGYDAGHARRLLPRRPQPQRRRTTSTPTPSTCTRQARPAQSAAGAAVQLPRRGEAPSPAATPVAGRQLDVGGARRRRYLLGRRTPSGRGSASENGTPHVDDDGVQVAPPTWSCCSSPYQPSPADARVAGGRHGRRGRGVGVHRRQGHRRHVDAARRHQAGDAHRRRGQPDPAHARPHLGRAGRRRHHDRHLRPTRGAGAAVGSGMRAASHGGTVGLERSDRPRRTSA